MCNLDDQVQPHQAIVAVVPELVKRGPLPVPQRLRSVAQIIGGRKERRRAIERDVARRCIEDNVIDLLNNEAFYQYLVHGVILLAAVLLDRLKNAV